MLKIFFLFKIIMSAIDRLIKSNLIEKIRIYLIKFEILFLSKLKILNKKISKNIFYGLYKVIYIKHLQR